MKILGINVTVKKYFNDDMVNIVSNVIDQNFKRYKFKYEVTHEDGNCTILLKSGNIIFSKFKPGTVINSKDDILGRLESNTMAHFALAMMMSDLKESVGYENINGSETCSITIQIGTKEAPFKKL